MYLNNFDVSCFERALVNRSYGKNGCCKIQHLSCLVIFENIIVKIEEFDAINSFFVIFRI